MCFQSFSCCHDRMVVGFTTNCVLHGQVYSMQHYVIKFCQWLATGRWFSPGATVSSTNKTDHHDMTEILLKVALNTITLTLLIIHFNELIINMKVEIFTDHLYLLSNVISKYKWSVKVWTFKQHFLKGLSETRRAH